MQKIPNDDSMIYKYTPHDKCHRYDIIMENELWFAKIDSLNDPIDSNLAYNKKYTIDEIQEYWEDLSRNNPKYDLQENLKKYGDNKSFVEYQSKIFNRLRARIGVLCMSKNPKNILMWAHYANSHKGIVDGFDKNLVKGRETQQFVGVLDEMQYPQNRHYKLLSYTKQNGKDRDEQFIESLTIKAPDWAYEEEVRFINIGKSDIAIKFNMDCLKTIIFGVKTGKKERDSLIKCCKKHNFEHITFKQARFIDGKFELEFNEIKA